MPRSSHDNPLLPLRPVTVARPTPRDRRHVVIVASTTTLVLALIGSLNLFSAPSFAPRVHVRWVPGLSDIARAEHERQLKLVAGEHLEGETWAYDLADSSSPGVQAIVGDRSVADTNDIDRARGTVSVDAPNGTTRIGSDALGPLREAPFVPWLTRFAFSLLGLSGLWLLTTGRRRPGST
jgi:hypothetical protein